MIVYGDASYWRSLHEFVESFEGALDRLRRPTAAGSFDELRSLLIEAGQLEQGAEDVPEGMMQAMSAIRSLTDCVAMRFVKFWLTGDTVLGPAEVDELTQAVERLRRCPDDRLKIRVPEGFAFYSLFPEQYCVAAERWSRDHAERRNVRIAAVGIRSIGTSLSAVVSARLKSLGWDVRRTTVRPAGHPFDRRATIDADWHGSAELAVVVDEGPGASGSSMAAVAHALADAGVARSAISFFPGHRNEPGPQAAEHVRQWWASAPRYVAETADLRWGWRSLTQILAASTSTLLEDLPPIKQVEDLSGGQWRRHVCGDASEWPPAFVPFERAKYRVKMPGGKKILWKFDGLIRSADRYSARAPWNPSILRKVMGFVAMEWVEGQPMRAEHADADFIRQMGRYIAAVASAPLTRDEVTCGHARLRNMLYWNTRELLDDEYAATATRCADAAYRSGETGRFPAYGDGRMGPVEWVRAGRSQRRKVDWFGHDRDHTIVGRQPWLWDLAGAAVEWGLDDTTEPLLFKASDASACPAELRTFYRAAYAAFRAGICDLCRQSAGHDAEERKRLHNAQNGFTDRLRHELDRAR